MEFVKTDKAPAAIGPYSQATVANGMVFTSGQIALTPAGEMLDGGVELQAKQVLENLKYVLEAAGSSFENVVKSNVYLSDMENFTVVNAMYESYFASHKPARSTIAVKTLPKNALVEIECIALIKT